MTDSEGKLKLPDWIDEWADAAELGTRDDREAVTAAMHRAFLEGYNAGAEATAISVRATLENATERITNLERSLADLQTQLAARGSGKRKVNT